MTVVAVTMVKDEADIVGATVGHMVTQVDAVIVADNQSTDGTRSILESLPVMIIDDEEPGYYQADKMTRLAHLARIEMDANWVIPFDADEWWMSPHGRLADVLKANTAWPVLEAELFDHVASAADPNESDPVDRMQWRRQSPIPLPKVACQTGEDLLIWQGNHGATYSAPHTQLAGSLVVHHFPYRSPEQFARKAINGAAAYAATDLPSNVGQHWREYGRIAEQNGPGALHDVFRRWFWSSDPKADGLVFDPVRK